MEILTVLKAFPFKQIYLGRLQISSSPVSKVGLSTFFSWVVFFFFLAPAPSFFWLVGSTTFAFRCVICPGLVRVACMCLEVWGEILSCREGFFLGVPQKSQRHLWLATSALAMSGLDLTFALPKRSLVRGVGTSRCLGLSESSSEVLCWGVADSLFY